MKCVPDFLQYTYRINSHQYTDQDLHYKYSTDMIYIRANDRSHTIMCLYLRMIYLRLSFVLTLQYLPCTTHNQSPLAKQVRRGESATTNQLTDKMNFCHPLFYITPIFSIQETRERKRPKDNNCKSGGLQRNAVNKVSLRCTFSIKALIIK